jgi:cobalamin biosynthetic protein CobC
MRLRLKEDSKRLNNCLSAAGLSLFGGTSLFTLVRDERAPSLFIHLMEKGILTRSFDERPADLRFGLPGDEAEWARLEAALASF